MQQINATFSGPSHGRHIGAPIGSSGTNERLGEGEGFDDHKTGTHSTPQGSRGRRDLRRQRPTRERAGSAGTGGRRLAHPAPDRRHRREPLVRQALRHVHAGARPVDRQPAVEGHRESRRIARSQRGARAAAHGQRHRHLQPRPDPDGRLQPSPAAEHDVRHRPAAKRPRSTLPGGPPQRAVPDHEVHRVPERLRRRPDPPLLPDAAADGPGPQRPLRVERPDRRAPYRTATPTTRRSRSSSSATGGCRRCPAGAGTTSRTRRPRQPTRTFPPTAQPWGTSSTSSTSATAGEARTFSGSARRRSAGWP